MGTLHPRLRILPPYGCGGMLLKWGLREPLHLFRHGEQAF
jgi:hypothetical protein